jgi:hypothetical protein
MQNQNIMSNKFDLNWSTSFSYRGETIEIGLEQALFVAFCLFFSSVEHAKILLIILAQQH